jgi:hypothetical protein
MSEYQYYEFQAVDRPLTGEQMTGLRSPSSRATITPPQCDVWDRRRHSHLTRTSPTRDSPASRNLGVPALHVHLSDGQHGRVRLVDASVTRITSVSRVVDALRESTPPALSLAPYCRSLRGLLLSVATSATAS